MLKACFIGAGGRARHAHYPSVVRLDAVEVVGICELDAERLESVQAEYNFPRTFTDHREMLDAVDPDIVYCIMNQKWLQQPALDCLNAGKHLLIEKPPGASSAETQQMLDAAVANNVWCMVALQRRFAAVTIEAMRRLSGKGPVSLATTTFNKQILGGDGMEANTTLWDDVVHVVDLLRHLCGGESVEVTAYRDSFGSQSRNCYSAHIRFDNDATGTVFGNRASGGRVIRFELHGVGLGCYAKIPDELEVYEDNERSVLTGWELQGCDREDVLRYEGSLTMHEHFIESVTKGTVPLTDLRDVIRTVHLVDQIEGPS
jgi:predicted dehydrogenase